MYVCLCVCLCAYMHISVYVCVCVHAVNKHYVQGSLCCKLVVGEHCNTSHFTVLSFQQMAREEREAQAAHQRNREMLDVLRTQMAALETQKEEAKRLKEEELQLMVSCPAFQLKGEMKSRSV